MKFTVVWNDDLARVQTLSGLVGRKLKAYGLSFGWLFLGIIKSEKEGERK